MRKKKSQPSKFNNQVSINLALASLKEIQLLRQRPRYEGSHDLDILDQFFFVSVFWIKYIMNASSALTFFMRIC